MSTNLSDTVLAKSALSDTVLPDTVLPAVVLPSTAPCTGHVGRVTSDGSVWVDFPGNRAGLVRARLATAPGVVLRAETPVLLVFEQEDPGRPIVIAAIEDRLLRSEAAVPSSAPSEEVPSCAAVVDGERLVLEGREEITLRCGKASITLRKDGKITIRGVELLSRASGTNRIRGGSVAIN